MQDWYSSPKTYSDYVSGPDGHVMRVNSNAPENSHCFNVSGKWPNGRLVIGFVHASSVNDVRDIMFRNNIPVTHINLSY